MVEALIENIKNTVASNKLLSFIVDKLDKIKSEKLMIRMINIITVVSSDNINYSDLHQLVFNGLPDDIPSLRSLIWRILLNNLSLNFNEWEENLTSSRKKYEEYSKRFIDTKFSFTQKQDHPLAMVEKSQWKKFFNDIDLYEEITKDIRRTRTHMSFFFMPYVSNREITGEQITKAADITKNEHTSHRVKKDFESNADVMTRILFIYGKLHPEVRYVQGMNELLAPIFFCFSLDTNPFCLPYLEADAFTCFENLMSVVKDVFIRGVDKTETGIEARMHRLSQLLKFIDYDVYNKLQKENIEMQFFAFRWFTLFFTQDFEMPDILRLWDSLLSEDDIFDFMNMIILAILRMKRVDILESEFSGVMMQLQDLEGVEVEKLIRGGVKVREDLNKKI